MAEKETVKQVEENIPEPDKQTESKKDVDKTIKEATKVDENVKKANDEIVEKMSDLHIDRDVRDETGEQEETKEDKGEDVKPKRDITPTRKVERRNKPDAEPSDVLDRLSGAAVKQKVC